MVRIQRSILQVVPLVLAAVCGALAQQSSPKFLDGDPMIAVPEIASAEKARLLGVDDLYDFIIQSAHYKTQSKPTLGINTLGEVPNSSWFTNRQGSRPLSLQEVRRGPRVHGEPVAPFTVIAAKSQGVTPGFRLRDARGHIYFVKVDPISNPEMATAADVMGSLFLYAAGYNVAENYILVAQRSDFSIDPKATFSAPSGQKHPLTRADLRKVVKRMPIGPHGEIRALASLQVEGKILGPFRYTGTRSDDPNDLVPHEQRRDLRGLAVICAWLNHTDAKADNSMDTLVGTGVNARVVHHLLDFGALFGSDSDIAKDPRHGQEFFLPTSKKQASRIFTLGAYPESWERVRYRHDLPSTGNFTSKGFVPATWKPNYPNPAFLEMTTNDAYWGAKIVASFTNEQIRAIVSEGKFSSPAATDYVASVLETRRDMVASYWFSRVLPLESFSLADNRLTFEDLSDRFHYVHAPRSLTYEWARYDNTRGISEVVPGTSADLPETLRGSDADYIQCRIRDAQSHQFVLAYFKRDQGHWIPVGLERGS